MGSDKTTSSDETFVQQVNASMAGVEQLRADGLKRTRLICSVQTEGLEREHKRLLEKLGAQHPRVIEMESRIKAQPQVLAHLDAEIVKSKISVPKTDSSTWMVHGRVFDKNRKNVAGLTVSLHDEKGTWLSQMGRACTDDRGYFAIKYAPKDPKETATLHSVFLQVFDKKRTLLYRDTASLAVTPGLIDYLEIYLGQEEVPCTTPEADPVTPTPASKVWTVKGKVTDANGRPAGGMIVKAYDKELLFADKLGQTFTCPNGSYEFVYDAKDFPSFFKAKPGVYVKVVDKAGKTLVTTKKAVRVTAGRVETINLKLLRTEPDDPGQTKK
jgi:protocatechuate 3,4-dioxygenase beta subunit